MKHRHLLWGISILLILTGPALFGVARAALPPNPHQQITEYTGPATCAKCHPDAAAEVVQSAHYLGRAVGGEHVPEMKAGMVGFLESYGEMLPASNASINWINLVQPANAKLPPQPVGCALCHVGLGAQPNPPEKLSENDKANVDCLICHAPNYERAIVKEGNIFRLAPTQATDLLQAVQNVGRPTDETCMRCHFRSSILRRGDPPMKETDVHVRAGLDCLRCHVVKEHRFAGSGDLRVQDLPEEQVACTNCHKRPIHPGENAAAIEAHLERIACQTCHIPATGPHENLPTQLLMDWVKPGRLDKLKGVYQPRGEFAAIVKPVYYWWNGKVRAYPPGPVKTSPDDPSARIFPWKVDQVIVPMDAQSGITLPIKVDAFVLNGKVDEAVTEGVKILGMAYSGQWKAGKAVEEYVLNHAVAPKNKALQCKDCHAAKGRLDYVALGYTAEKAEQLSHPLEFKPTATPTPTNTPTPGPSPMPVASLGPSPTSTPSLTPSPTLTPTPTPSPTRTRRPSPTRTPTPTPSLVPGGSTWWVGLLVLAGVVVIVGALLYRRRLRPRL